MRFQLALVGGFLCVLHADAIRFSSRRDTDTGSNSPTRAERSGLPLGRIAARSAGRFSPRRRSRSWASVPAPATAAARVTSVRTIPRQVDAVTREAANSNTASLALARRGRAESRVQEMIAAEANKTISARRIFSSPAMVQASASRAVFRQGGKAVPLSRVTRNKGIVTQNGAPVSTLISDLLVIIDGTVLIINDGFIQIHGEKFAVCDNLVAPASIFTCCGGSLFAKFDPTFGTLEELQCCEDNFFIPSSEICCSGIIFKKETKLGQAIHCCDAAYFIPVLEVCCSGSIFLNFPVNEISCCGTKAFHNVFDTCCGSSIVEVGSLAPCSCLDPAVSVCCDGVPQAKLRNGVCCGRSQFDPSTQLCCGGVPHSKANRACCGVTSIRTTFLQCCDGSMPFPRFIQCGAA